MSPASARNAPRASAAARLVRRWYAARPPPLALRPPAWLFAALVRLRRALYRRRLLPGVRLPVPVVIVGNIAVGGSGKTPLTAWLAARLHERGVRVGIVTRGYLGNSRGPVEVVPQSAAELAGDEALWLARAVPVPVVAGRDRAAAGRLLAERHGVELILADDGLQHYRLARDAEIVAVDAARGFGNGALLPAGPLREPVSRLAAATAIVLKGEGTPALPAGVPVVRAGTVVRAAIRLSDSSMRPLADFRAGPVRALAAIADPESFFRALERAGLQLERHPLPDHAAVAGLVAALPADRPLLMTDKDAVKLAVPPAHVWRVPLELAFSQSDQATLVDIVMRRLPPSKTRSR